MDGKDDNGKPIMRYDSKWLDGHYEGNKFYLGHSCDEWIIGDHKQARAFVKQLQELIDRNPE